MKKQYFFIAFLLIQISGFANSNSENNIINKSFLEITTLVTPFFNPIGPLCLNYVPPALPAVSTNGISGTWSPSVIETSFVGVTTYTFTPDQGQDAASVSMNIEVVASSSINLVSELYTTQQTIVPNQPILDIVYQLVGATSATVYGLPPGVYSTIEGNLLTIHGFPIFVGFFQYFITLDNGCPGTDLVTGFINVVPFPLTLLSGNDTQQVCIDTQISDIVYATDGVSSPIVSGLPAGVTGNLQNGNFIISGAPIVSGLFPFTIVVTNELGSSYSYGTITSSPNVSLTLSSAASTQNQTVSSNTAISAIVYVLGNGATGAFVTGLPTGVSANFTAGTATITGTPTVCGFFPYIITTTGGCGAATITGTIAVSGAPLNLTCDFVNSTPTSMAFDWSNIVGFTSYDYAYTIGNGPTVTGNQVSPSNFQVTNVLPGQSVTFTVTSVGSICNTSETVTCILEPLANREFSKDYFNYYPNPVHDLLHVESNTAITKVSLFNLLGQKVIEVTGNQNTMQLNVETLQNGVYLIHVDSESGSQTKKIVKQ